jgi:competence protein ComEC
MPTAIATTIAVPAAAQLACTPVLVLAFGQLTPYAIPANLLAAPAVVPATVAGVVCAVAASFNVAMAVPLAWLGAMPTAWIALTARVLASLPAAGLPWPGGWRSDLAVSLLVLAAVRRNRRRDDRPHRAILSRLRADRPRG